MRRAQSSGHVAPIEWQSDELERDRLLAIADFRKERLHEPLEQYLLEFDRVRSDFENLLHISGDLSDLDSKAIDILTDPQHRESFRYLAGPPLSSDDLQTVVDGSLSVAALRKDPELADRFVRTIRAVMDQRRFPWIAEGREATAIERHASILATVALIAAQRVQTARRSTGKSRQEQSVRDALSEAGLTPQSAPTRAIRTAADWPPEGRFYPNEVTLVNRKADLLVRPWDGRLMPIECKVSNSSINSVKRLNNDAAAKATAWLRDLGVTQIVPVAILSGVYNRLNLEDAQNRGLMLVWAHRLVDLTDWIESTRPA